MVMCGKLITSKISNPTPKSKTISLLLPFCLNTIKKIPIPIKIEIEIVLDNNHTIPENCIEVTVKINWGIPKIINATDNDKSITVIFNEVRFSKKNPDLIFLPTKYRKIPKGIAIIDDK